MYSVKKERDFVQRRYYRVFRQDRVRDVSDKYESGISFQKKMAVHFSRMCQAEIPVVFPDEKITFTRTNKNITPAYIYEDIAAEFDTKKKFYNVINNVCPDYSILLSKGLTGIMREIETSCKKDDNRSKDFKESCRIIIDAVDLLVKRYQKEAERIGNTYVKEILEKAPMYPAESFAQALQSIRILSSMFYLAGNYQLGFGRIDQYLIDYYENDVKKGYLTRESAEELLREFFISLNRDTDLYFGVQQGDNGQSMMLGGCRPDGSDGVNELTYMILRVSKDLKLIDPKINLRIDSNTPYDLLVLGCELTKAGLGFPQYSNDEVVIPALVKAGYKLEDARNYTVAACWEFIIPGKGLDIVNQGAVSFPYAVNQAVMECDTETVSTEQIETAVRDNIYEQVNHILRNRDQHLLPSPIVSLFFYESIKECRDITETANYRNRGLHGAGSANAADALYMVKDLIHHGQRKKLGCLKKAVLDNFDNEELLLRELRNDKNKVGNNIEDVDRCLKFIFDVFADACDHYSTRDCKIRPGTGSAQFYVWLANRMNDWMIEPAVDATIDGRRKGEAFPSSLAPACGVKVNGLLSVLKSFSVIDYSRVMNGGPITVEFSSTVLSTKEGVNKLAAMIQYFVKLGNQQLQLNILDYHVLQDAIKHPEKHSNLIVRVWGWSGYFCELAPEFQRQIINRHRYSI